MKKDRKVVYEAMNEAYEAFENYIYDHGYDPAFFQLYLTGYILDTELEKLEEVRCNFNRTGTAKFQYEDREEI